MTKLWDDLKQNMKDWSNAAVEKAEEVSKKAVAKTEELTKISKIKIEIHQLQRDKGKTFEKLGKMVYKKAKDENLANFTGNTEFFSLVEQVDGYRKSVVEKETEIERIRDEYGIQESDFMEPESVDSEESSAEEEPVKKETKKSKAKKG